MQDGRSRVLQRLRGSTAARGRASKAAAEEARVQQLARKIGNEEIAQRIRKGETNRELLLAFIGDRLQTARAAQVREAAETMRGSHWENWRSIADSHDHETSKPDPTRWHAVAQAYDLALTAICQGDLARGRQLVERAIEVEQHVWDNLTNLVFTEDLEKGVAEDRGWMDDVASDTPQTSSIGIPSELRDLIEAMLLESRTMPDPMNRRRRRDPWWTLEEDEEEEENGDGGGAAG